jgi:hypothetical protein
LGCHHRSSGACEDLPRMGHCLRCRVRGIDGDSRSVAREASGGERGSRTRADD